MTDIGDALKSLPNSFGYGINSSGQVAGTAYNSSYSSYDAFFYDGATTVDLGTFGGQDASALALNDQAQMTGYVTSAGGFDQAFRYSGGAAVLLGTLGGHYSYGLAINNSNVIVGGSFTDTGDTIYHAFIAMANSLVDLNLLLDATGVGWTLVEARAINDSGQIAGIGTYNGGRHTFLLTPLSALPPVIKSVRVSGADVLISFTTVANGTYSVETSPAISAVSWATVKTGIAGNGGLVQVADSGGAGATSRFYRIRQTSP